MWKAARCANDQKDSGEPAVFNRHLAIALMVSRTLSNLPFCCRVYSQVNSWRVHCCKQTLTNFPILNILALSITTLRVFPSSAKNLISVDK